jgi:hypothetical protein
MNEGEETFGSVYFAIFGAVVLVFGVVEFIATAIGGITWGILDTSGVFDPMFLPWRAIILVSGGLLYLSSVKKFAEIGQLAKAVIASVMIWIVAGSAIWTRIAASIPAEEGWFKTLEDFLASYAPPYCPALLLLLPSLVIVYYIKKES